LTTSCIVYTNIQPVVKPVWQPAVSCKQGIRVLVLRSTINNTLTINLTKQKPSKFVPEIHTSHNGLILGHGWLRISYLHIQNSSYTEIFTPPSENDPVILKIYIGSWMTYIKIFVHTSMEKNKCVSSLYQARNTKIYKSRREKLKFYPLLSYVLQQEPPPLATYQLSCLHQPINWKC